MVKNIAMRHRNDGFSSGNGGFPFFPREFIVMSNDTRMKKHKDLLAILRSNQMRITPARRVLLQFILDNRSRQIPLKEFYSVMERMIPGFDRSSVYRNLETLKRLEIIQELSLAKGKVYQYLLDRQISHFVICKVCGKSHRGNQDLFDRIESALKEIHGFAKANLSVIFYGVCTKCEKSK